MATSAIPCTWRDSSRTSPLAAASVKAGQADYIVYQDGDHYFSGFQQDVIRDIAEWLDGLGLAPRPRARVDFIDTLQQVEWNGVEFTVRSPGLLYEPGGVDSSVLRSRSAFLLIPDYMGALLDEDMDDLARAIAAKGHSVIVPQLQSDGYRGAQNASFDRVRDDLAAWQEAGEPTMEDRVRGEVRQIVETHQPEPLDGKIHDELIRLKNEGEKEILARLEKSS